MPSAEVTQKEAVVFRNAKTLTADHYAASFRNHFGDGAVHRLQKEIGFVGKRLLRLPSTERSSFFDPWFGEENARHLRAVAQSVRGLPQDAAAATAGDATGAAGPRRAPRIVFLQGVMPRSGTNYLQSLLELHPDVVVNPYGIRELPFLNTVEDARAYEGRFLRLYQRNRESFRDLETFCYMVSGFLRRIEAEFPADKTVVIKSPHTRMMRYFPYLFPAERCLIVLRDGKRAVQSTIDTWPLRFLGRTFADVCREWSFGTEAALEAQSRMSADACRLVRFEDAVAAPDGTVRDLMRFLELEEGRYPFERIGDLPILGSSRASRSNGEVSWTPVEKPKGFDPSKRPIEWSRKRRTVFDAVAGDMQKKAGYAS